MNAKHNFDPQQIIAHLPMEPGVYQMLDAHGKVLYIGKARQLKDRVSSYFHGKVTHAKTAALLKHVVAIDFTVTRNENEALLLEYNLIQQHKPRYNVLLRDDKSYPYIYLSSQQTFPRLDFYRGQRQGKGKFFGPYPSVRAVRETLNLLQKTFLIRSCKDTFFRNRSRPCLQYQIKRCSAPCVDYIQPEEYQQAVHYAQLFLSGHSQQVMDELTQRMQVASEQLAFEQAAKYRDQIRSLRKIQAQQVVNIQAGDVDIIALATQQQWHVVYVLTIRDGRVLGSRSYFPKTPKQTPPAEVLSAFIQQYYLNSAHRHQIPQRIVVNVALEEQSWLTDFLSECRGSAVLIQSPQRGKYQQWLQMAYENATAVLNTHIARHTDLQRQLSELQTALQLENSPQRMDCFDISHTLGESTVASCVVFNQEGAVKSEYRRFNLTDVPKADDYAAMQQALMRHYRKLKEKEASIPDVLLIDGGKGQVKIAEQVLEELQISQVVIVGIAKGPSRKPGLETLICRGQSLRLPADSAALHLLQHIRDEAHRFAITGHRKQQAKKRKTSSLEDIPGIGSKRRCALLNHFGGLQEIKQASVHELAQVSGISPALAQALFAALH